MQSVFVDFETVCNYIIEHFTAKISGIPDLAGILESRESWPKFRGIRNLV